MPEWLSQLEAAQALVSSGKPAAASEIYHEAIRKNAQDSAAVNWLTFNLMLSEVARYGQSAARPFLSRLISSDISWAAKLYALEIALAGTDPSDANLDALFQDVVSILETYASASLSPADVNIMSCQTIARHMARLFDDISGQDLFSTEDHEAQFPLVTAHPSTPSQLLPPRQFNRIPHVLDLTYRRHTPPARPLGIRSIGRCYAARIGQNVVIFDKRGEPVGIPYGPHPRFLKMALKPFFKPRFLRRRIKAPSLFIGDYFSQSINYCHWVLDNLPRIAAANLTNLKFDNIVGSFELETDFQRETLNRVSVGGQKYIGLAPGDGLIEFENLLYADNDNLRHINHPAYGCDRVLLENLRQNLMAKTPATPRRRLYIPRKHNRVVINEEALKALLARFSFETVDTDTMSLTQQIDAFSNAGAVIGPHGAAFTNLLFAPANCKFLELFPPFGGSTSFYQLSSALDIDYACFIDDQSQGPLRDVSNGIVNNTAGVDADLAFVEKWLREKVITDAGELKI